MFGIRWCAMGAISFCFYRTVCFYLHLFPTFSFPVFPVETVCPQLVALGSWMLKSKTKSELYLSSKFDPDMITINAKLRGYGLNPLK